MTITDQMVEAAIIANRRTVGAYITGVSGWPGDYDDDEQAIMRESMRAALEAAEAAASPDPQDATIAALRAEVKRLRDALFEMIRTLDGCGHIERGAGCMTVDAQIRRTEINRVPAWAVEEARTALDNAT